MPHFRRLTLSEFQELAGANDHERAEAVGAVIVARYASTIVLHHCLSPEQAQARCEAALPGIPYGTTADMPSTTRARVEECEWRAAEDGELQRTKRSDVPDDAIVVEDHLQPHVWL